MSIQYISIMKNGYFLIITIVFMVSIISNSAHAQTSPISLSMQKDMYYPNDVVVINGTSTSNQLVTVEIKNPFDKSVFEKSLLPSAKGTFSITYVVDSYPTKGTYVVIATQNSETNASYFGVYTKPAIRLEASMDKINYENADKANITIFDLAESMIDIKILDNSQMQQFEDKITTAHDGHAVYPLNITSYPVGVYSILVTSSTGQVKLGFSVGLVPTGAQISVNTEKNTYSLGDSILVLGTVNANSLVHILLTDSNGTLVKSIQTYSDNTGHFTIPDLKIPTNAVPGNWQIVASSGVNHQSLSILVVRSVYGVSDNPVIHAYGPGGPGVPIHIDTPLQQSLRGIASKDVQCKEGLQLAIKSKDNSPACVSDTIIGRLVRQSWWAWNDKVGDTIVNTSDKRDFDKSCGISEIMSSIIGTSGFVKDTLPHDGITFPGMNLTEPAGAGIQFAIKPNSTAQITFAYDFNPYPGSNCKVTTKDAMTYINMARSNALISNTTGSNTPISDFPSSPDIFEVDKTKIRTDLPLLGDSGDVQVKLINAEDLNDHVVKVTYQITSKLTSQMGKSYLLNFWWHSAVGVTVGNDLYNGTAFSGPRFG
ncbi:exported protein of unknown function [Nitrosotalea devaniterrae]|uniref:Macroglobulin domain-containing protein n=1 Tax=Nitrosotalea devaniterrae TaxID=1078905 RepID=A0A128A207_9ARCH|nr:exported protein of unknown function [Candidatus Nitrosotalea devanaterra]